MLRQTIIFLFSVILISCGQNTGRKKNATADPKSETGRASMYTQIKGLLAGQPVTMNLIRTTATDFTGWYSYDMVGEPIQFWGQTDSTGHVVLTEERVDGSQNPYFKGNLGDNGVYEGKWYDEEKGISMDFKLEPNTDPKLIHFDVIYRTDSAKLIPARPNSPVGNVVTTVLWPRGGTDEAVLQKLRSAITRLDTEKDFPDGEAFAKYLTEQFKTGYTAGMDKKELDDILGSEGAAMAFNYVEDTRMSIPWNQWPLLVVEKFLYSYTGGAHGNHASGFIVFDLEKGKVLKPEDVFLPGYKPIVGKALEKAFRKKYGIGENESLKDNLLFEEHVEPNGNFYLTDKGVVFSYSPYEVAPFAAGQISAFIPFEEIRSVMQPTYLPK